MANSVGTRQFTIFAQDPSVKGPDGSILRTRVAIPYEVLGPGPRGYRVHVVDYDASEGLLYKPADLGGGADAFAGLGDAALLASPAFHAQNVYAVVMMLLARFEHALGRRISWGFNNHQIYVCPHAFSGKNAYFSDHHLGLFFGYFPGKDGAPVFTCLSHDIIAHEATHALIGGLRTKYALPSRPDQVAFHEGFADIAALLSVFGQSEVVEHLLASDPADGSKIPVEHLTAQKIRASALLGLADDFESDTSSRSDGVLRRSVGLPPDPGALKSPEFEEPHRRGEVLAAAVLNAFVRVWCTRLDGWIPDREVPGNKASAGKYRVVEDGVKAAQHLLTMVIRALDYCPVADIRLGDFISAMLTADRELLIDDGKYRYRDVLREEFRKWGVTPSSGEPGKEQEGEIAEEGAWEKPGDMGSLRYEGVHRTSLENDPNEVFRFLWENRRVLRIFEDAYTKVISVRPCIRVAPDGFILRETVCEYFQELDLEAGRLAGLKASPEGKGIRKPAGMLDGTEVCLNGGGVLIFDEFGHLKYHIRSRLDNEQEQEARLEYLWRKQVKNRSGGYGFYDSLPAERPDALTGPLRRKRREESWDD